MKILTIVLICLSVNGVAQDIHFSQLGVNSLVNNPAAAGFYQGWERLSVNHKNQWVNANTSFLTTSIAADVNLFKPRGDKGAYLGVGIIFYNDIGGDSEFGIRHFSASISGIVPLNKYNRMSFGFSSGFGQKSANLDGVLFPSQFDGQLLNASISSSELNTLSSRLYGDFSLGFLYQYGSTSQTISASDETALTLGAGYHHFNSPQLNFDGFYAENIYSKMSFGGELIKDFSGSKMGIETLANYYRQGPHREFFLSTLARYQLVSGSKMTRLRKSVVLSYGLGYRHRDAIIPMLKYQKGVWQFGLSYDITISSLGSFTRGGGLEFSLIYNSQRFALFNRR